MKQGNYQPIDLQLSLKSPSNNTRNNITQTRWKYPLAVKCSELESNLLVENWFRHCIRRESKWRTEPRVRCWWHLSRITIMCMALVDGESKHGTQYVRRTGTLIRDWGCDEWHTSFPPKRPPSNVFVSKSMFRLLAKNAKNADLQVLTSHNYA